MTFKLNQFEFMYGQSREIKEVNHLVFAWKHPHWMRLGNILEKVTPEYVVWRSKKIEDIVLLPSRMKVPTLDPPPRQPYETEIVRSKFAIERLEIEQKYKSLWDVAEKSKDNA